MALAALPEWQQTWIAQGLAHKARPSACAATADRGHDRTDDRRRHPVLSEEPTVLKTITYAQFGAMFIDLNDIIAWGIEADGRPTYEVADSIVSDRLVERDQVDPAEALEVAKRFLFQLEVGGARRVHAAT
jgi:hypothetical protein